MHKVVAHPAPGIQHHSPATHFKEYDHKPTTTEDSHYKYQPTTKEDSYYQKPNTTIPPHSADTPTPAQPVAKSSLTS
ncbi:hypothetical protein BC830DRAFT_819447 [Chytriomyces sp. MP71]|nr:hypothetical protein BC830DRAFT_819447 [Chytriomyces sp. MP71]